MFLVLPSLDEPEAQVYFSGPFSPRNPVLFAGLKIPKINVGRGLQILKRSRKYTSRLSITALSILAKQMS